MYNLQEGRRKGQWTPAGSLDSNPHNPHLLSTTVLRPSPDYSHLGDPPPLRLPVSPSLE